MPMTRPAISAPVISPVDGLLGGFGSRESKYGKQSTNGELIFSDYDPFFIHQYEGTNLSENTQTNFRNSAMSNFSLHKFRVIQVHRFPTKLMKPCIL